MTMTCSLGEMMIAALARTNEDGTLVFHGFGSPLVQLAMYVAKRTHTPRIRTSSTEVSGYRPFSCMWPSSSKANKPSSVTSH